jgi:beta-lactamase superfamily II metal-dependent hydrolase
MGIEIDFFPVGTGERSGDAIALRFGNLEGPPDDQVVIVIDGGTKATGEQIVNHVKTVYGRNWVNVVISGHPDADHSSGLTVVLEGLAVRDSLVMHLPWEHAEDVSKMFLNGRVIASKLEERVQKALQSARDIEAIAKAKKIKIVEPFTGIAGFGGKIRILGPTQKYYESLLPEFRCADDLFMKAMKVLKEAEEALIGWVRETLDPSTETLVDPEPDATSPENNTSALVLVSVEGSNILFTGDAGAPALLAGAQYATAVGVDLTRLAMWQVPHHGSRHNLGPTVLSRIKAPLAVISAAPEAPKHPSRKVVNALIRRGHAVRATQGDHLLFSRGAPDRTGYIQAAALPFYDQVEG